MAPNDRAPVHDERWGDHVPFSLRYNIVVAKGDPYKFMTMLAHRLHTLFEHEFGYQNHSYFISRLVTESFGRFHAKRDQTYANTVYYYFSPETIDKDVNANLANDPQYRELSQYNPVRDKEGHAKATKIERDTRPARYIFHRQNLIAIRLEVLQSIFVLGN